MADWTQIAEDIVAAAAGAVGAGWNAADPAIKAQVAALVQVGQEIAAQASASPPAITPDQYNYLKYTQQSAMQSVLVNAEAIGVVVAGQAAAAAWGVVEKALVGLLPFAI